MSVARSKMSMTMDVKCKEVTDCLKSDKTPYNQPDIVDQVYKLKRNENMCLAIVMDTSQSLSFRKEVLRTVTC